MVGVVVVALIAVNTPNHRVFRSSHKTQKCGNRRWGCLRNRRRHPWSFHVLRCFADKWMHFYLSFFLCVCPQPHVDTLEPCRGCISTLPHFLCCLANTSCLATRGRQITNWSCPVAAGRVDGGQGGKHSLSSSPASAPGPERVSESGMLSQVTLASPRKAANRCRYDVGSKTLLLTCGRQVMSSLAILLVTDKERLREGWAGEQTDQMKRKKDV